MFVCLFVLGDSCDIDFTVNQNQYIVWAIGGLGETAFIHFQRSDSKCMGGRSSSMNSGI